MKPWRIETPAESMDYPLGQLIFNCNSSPEIRRLSISVICLITNRHRVGEDDFYVCDDGKD